MRARFDSLRHREGGQAIIEMALLMPFIFLLILLVIEFGFFLWMNLNINNAAREAVRYAAVGKPIGGSTCASEPDTVKGRAYKVALGRITCGEVFASFADPDGNGLRTGDDVTVQIRHAYDPITPGFSILGIGTTVTMCARSESRIEVPLIPTPAPTAVACPVATATPKAGG